MTAKDKKQSFRFVDPHVHFYDMKHPTLHYAIYVTHDQLRVMLFSGHFNTHVQKK